MQFAREEMELFLKWAFLIDRLVMSAAIMWTKVGITF